MSIEIAVVVDVQATVCFDVEPGEVVTQERIDEAINAIARELDDAPVRGSGASFYATIYRDDKNLDLAAYDYESGQGWAVRRGAVVEAPTPAAPRSTYGEDMRRGELSDDLGESPDF